MKSARNLGQNNSVRDELRMKNVKCRYEGAISRPGCHVVTELNVSYGKVIKMDDYKY
jgi:hypothetical protein